jgi:hypothetical protein
MFIWGGLHEVLKFLLKELPLVPKAIQEILSLKLFKVLQILTVSFWDLTAQALEWKLFTQQVVMQSCGCKQSQRN